MSRLLIRVGGAVQGVGFRPYVHGLASSLGLKGYVANTPEGVVIEVEGEAVESFIKRLKPGAPPLSKIVSIDISPMPPVGYEEFEIRKSTAGDSPALTPVSPDVSVCDACLKELFDETDRRFLYPFINCTDCGPRYTITTRIPYDRPNTTMSDFVMCPECEAEYGEPSNRRFHAEPIACPRCGPKMKLILNGADAARNKEGEAVGETVELLKGGAIVAVKSLGGFHLACDATNEGAVRELRKRKRKSNKPFALMAPDVETIRKYCLVSEEEEAMLSSFERPVVLLLKRAGGPSLPEEIAPRNKRLGFMLPYTPMHYLLFHPPKPLPSREGLLNNSRYHSGKGLLPLNPLLAEGRIRGDPLVMTSGNLSEEPIQTDGEEAIKKLGGIADAFLDHDRRIFMRTDDSVLKLRGDGSAVLIRRARGFVPGPIALGEDGPDVLAVGADIKNTFTLMKGAHAIVSQHIGDMENHETLRFFEETLENLMAVYKIAPVAVAHDMHPGYMSTKWALGQIGGQVADKHKNPLESPFSKVGSDQEPFSKEGFNKPFSANAPPRFPPLEKGGVGGFEKIGSVPIMPIQHHHAHIASVMAERGLRGKVIGVAFDGTGYGTDGTLWGGEFLIADAIDFKRAGHLRCVPLPGGERAIKEPWRTAVSYVESAFGSEALDCLRRVGFYERYESENIENVLRILHKVEFSPLSSGAGRLFDAVSAILGICDTNTFEGEAAIALEAASVDDINEDYPLDIKFKDIIEADFSFAIMRIIEDLSSGLDRGVIAAKFQNTVIEAVARVAVKLSSITGIRDVVLSGGVFQNDYLLNGVKEKFRSEHPYRGGAQPLSVHVNELVPPNDGGLSLGQAYILRERLKAGWKLKT